MTAGSLTEAVLKPRFHKEGTLYLKNLIPAYTLNPDGTVGITGRACTANHKEFRYSENARAGKIKRGQKTMG